MIQKISGLGSVVKHYKFRRFSTEARNEDVSDSILMDVANEFLALTIEARNQRSLGAGLYKLRLASKSGRGKSGGSRVVLAFKKDSLVIWLHLYGKNEKENVAHQDFEDLKKLSNVLLNATENQLMDLIKKGTLEEIKHV
jgi:hypothetical protein